MKVFAYKVVGGVPMSKFSLPLIHLLSLTLTGCCNTSKPISSYSELDSSYFVEPSHIHDLEDNLVYFYSETCGHCENLKAEIFSVIITTNLPLLLCEYSEEIPVVFIKEEVFSNYENNIISIMGVPSLMIIKNKKITSYYVGESEVLQGFI